MEIQEHPVLTSALGWFQSLPKLDKNQVFDVNISVFCARYMRFFSKNSQILIFSMLRRKKGVVPSAAIFFQLSPTELKRPEMSSTQTGKPLRGHTKIICLHETS